MTLDVHFLKCCDFGGLEEFQSFASEQSHFAFFTFIKECLTAEITYESSALVIGLKAELLGNEAQFQIRLIPWPED